MMDTNFQHTGKFLPDVDGGTLTLFTNSAGVICYEGLPIREFAITAIYV
jgi:hypothetical protein